MKISSITRGILIAAIALASCARTQTTRRGEDPNKSRRMITGSNVPQPVNRPTFSRTSADTPLESAARDRPGLTPTEPIVGAGDQSLYRLNEPSTGAGPAGSNPIPGGR